MPITFLSGTKIWQKTEELSSKAVRANPENSTYLDTYAWVLFMRKDYALAKFYMETAMKNGGDKNGSNY